MEDNFTFFMAFLPTKYESTATTTTKAIHKPYRIKKNET